MNLGAEFSAKAPATRPNYARVINDLWCGINEDAVTSSERESVQSLLSKAPAAIAQLNQITALPRMPGPNWQEADQILANMALEIVEFLLDFDSEEPKLSLQEVKTGIDIAQILAYSCPKKATKILDIFEETEIFVGSKDEAAYLDVLIQIRDIAAQETACNDADLAERQIDPVIL